MEMRRGYKQTEVGVIPEDWRVMQLGELTAIVSGGTPKTSEPLYWNGPIRWCTPTDITGCRSKYLIETERTISIDGLANCSAQLLPPGALLLCSRATIGEVRISSHEICTNQGFKALICKQGVSNEFLYYKILTMKSQMVERAIGSTFLEISKKATASLTLALPLPQEQAVIAEALGNADALIESLEQLITKKRQLKQGAMQELLLRKDGWVEKKLGKTATLKARIGWQGLTTAEYLDAGDFYLVTGTDFKNGYIDWEHCHYVTELRYKQDRNIQLKEHDVLVTKDGTIGKVALIFKLDKPATLNSGVFVIRPIEDAFYPDFFYYLLCSNLFMEFLGQLSAGSTINHLYQKDFVHFIYQTPATLDEQIAIATILSDMDAELASLEAKLAKVRQIKQGMMHELLTGRIRLLPPMVVS